MEVPMLVTDFLRRAARLYPEREAIVSLKGRFTYREFQERTRRLANSFRDLGVKKGDRVALLSPNTSEFLEVFFGLGSIGAILVSLNYRLIPDDFVYIVNHAEADVFISDAEFLPIVDAIRGELPNVKRYIAWSDDGSPITEGWTRYEDLLAAASPAPPPDAGLEESDIFSINYTSGTTARPKGVMLTHRNVYCNALNFIVHMRITDRDTNLCMTPYFHANGWGAPFAVTGMGGRHVCLRKADAEMMFRAIREERVTMMCMAPSIVAALLHHPNAVELAKGASVRIGSGGSPPPAEHIRKIYDELGWEFIHAYGLTETSPFLTMSAIKATQDEAQGEERVRILTRAGMEIITSEIRVADERGEDVPQDDTTVGEILARGNMVMKGYWRQPEETDKAIRDGWFHTGDMATWDAERTINIVDRKKDVIISGGENISSIEVEDILYKHPAVLEACVVGVPSERWGETVKALIVLRAGHTATEAEIIAFCRERMAHFKCPTSADFAESLPRTTTGKLQKFLIRAKYWEGSERRVN